MGGKVDEVGLNISCNEELNLPVRNVKTFEALELFLQNEDNELKMVSILIFEKLFHLRVF
jgi:hypothetical protein